MAKQSRESLSTPKIEGPGYPQAPHDLTDAQTARWDEIVQEWPEGHFRESDLHLLKSIVRSESLVEQLDAKIAADGLLIESFRGELKPNPAIMARNAVLKAIESSQRALRLCPSTRTRPESSSLRDPRGRAKKPWEA